MSLLSRLALRWHKLRGCRLGDLGPYTDKGTGHTLSHTRQRQCFLVEW